MHMAVFPTIEFPSVVHAPARLHFGNGLFLDCPEVDAGQHGMAHGMARQPMHFVEQPVRLPVAAREIPTGLVAYDDPPCPSITHQPAQQRVDDRAREKRSAAASDAGAGVCLRSAPRVGLEILEGGDVGQVISTSPSVPDAHCATPLIANVENAAIPGLHSRT